MLFVTRAEENEVKDTLERVIDYISQNEDTSTRDRQIVAQISTRAAIYPNSPQSKIPKFLPVPYIDHSLLPLEEFQALWRTGGIPLVLTGMLDRFKLPWDPQYFIDMYGEELCLVHDCSDGSVQNATVAGFFSAFLDPDGGGTSSKLKDWPPTADFKDTFPELFADFENALPYPSYTRRSGPLNLASHFPRNWIAPDLGPKMYNASPAPDFVSSDPGQEVIGTTNLHLDLTDAVNIMLYASGGHEDPLLSMDKGIPLCGAVWDIFPPSSANKIRAYLRDCDPLSDVDDPIHRQMYYLSESHLSELASQEVCSYRVFQQPGDAVFIPAGCPHQVRNRQNCVKVAVDFLSAENVSVCKNLVEEARKMAPIVQTAGNKGTQKEDVLQLWSCLGFAWKALEAVQDKIVLPDMVPTSCGGDHTDRASIDRGHTNQTFMGSVLGFVENMERDSKILATGTAYTSAGTTEGNTAPSSNSAVPTSSEVPTKDPAFASTLITPYGDLA